MQRVHDRLAGILVFRHRRPGGQGHQRLPQHMFVAAVDGPCAPAGRSSRLPPSSAHEQAHQATASPCAQCDHPVAQPSMTRRTRPRSARFRPGAPRGQVAGCSRGTDNRPSAARTGARIVKQTEDYRLVPGRGHAWRWSAFEVSSREETR
jgi:hypothetical protein